jgi:hypothetical protein
MPRQIVTTSNWINPHSNRRHTATATHCIASQSYTAQTNDADDTAFDDAVDGARTDARRRAHAIGIDRAAAGTRARVSSRARERG